MTLYDVVTAMIDKRLPEFKGSGVRREGGQAHFGRGRGTFFLSQTLTCYKQRNGKVVLTNTPYVEDK